MPGIAPPKPDMDMTSAYIGALGNLAGTAASSFKAFNASKPPTQAFNVNSQDLFNYKPDINFFDY